ncbi:MULTISPECIES: succinate dehydrogenase assembly factor 2 [unclassified Sulfitobacter]|jgi:antitoxin CptB|uniref:succinate dehydrogenase assembly factor 2 n=1 Tax=Sulfitobacter TaxID=60136 RepID=UPI001ADBE3FE|nr:succinate dehydrogenase assembly factor 2 [Sulfitobacter sp. R18_1]MBO9431692.1 succinate dehydrogenase assembly factor 2 [Sulfitobacter sp. R18_1]
MAEAPEHRIKRLQMRSMRRGIKEMDLILSAYAEARLPQMDDAGLTLYDQMLNENDHDLYLWVSGQAEAPAEYAGLIADIRGQLAEARG